MNGPETRSTKSSGTQCARARKAPIPKSELGSNRGEYSDAIDRRTDTASRRLDEKVGARCGHAADSRGRMRLHHTPRAAAAYQVDCDSRIQEQDLRAGLFAPHRN